MEPPRRFQLFALQWAIRIRNRLNRFNVSLRDLFHGISQVLSAVLCVYWAFQLPIPNKAILALTVVAVVMALADMSTKHKIVWVILVCVFAWIENRAINKDRQTFATEQAVLRQAEQANFERIVKENQKAFSRTMSRLDLIIESSREIGETTRRNLENVTGGDTFALIVPQTRSSETNIPLMIRSCGRNILTGVTVTIRRHRDFSKYFSDFLNTPQLSVGVLHPGEMRLIKATLSPELDDTGEDGYSVEITAQNNTFYQQLNFRRFHRSKADGPPDPWAFRFHVSKNIVRPNSILNKIIYLRTWSDELFPPQPWVGVCPDYSALE